MTRRERYAGTVLELGITRPLIFCGLCWVIGTALGTVRACWLIAQAEDVDVDCDDLDSEWTRLLLRGAS